MSHKITVVTVELENIAPENVWFVSDPHFDHANIIKYCNRPFSSVEEMNHTILENWKEAIKPDDIVFFLGDMSFGRGSREPRWWLWQLPGLIYYIKGSHDHGIRPSSYGLKCLLVADKIDLFSELLGKVMLVHSPDIGRTDYDLIIHGHAHNNRPLYDGDGKVNVSLDVTDFKPVSMEQILEITREKNA